DCPGRGRVVGAAELRHRVHVDLHPLHLRVRASQLDPAAVFHCCRNSATIPGRSRQSLPRPLSRPDTDSRATRHLSDRGRYRPARCGTSRQCPDRASPVGGPMPLTPVEVRHVELRRAWLRGYRRKPVDQLLEEIADSFEEVWRERADLSDRLEELETEAAKHRELEALLRSTLVSAERAAQDMKEQARRQAELIVPEAHAQSHPVTPPAAPQNPKRPQDTIHI